MFLDLYRFAENNHIVVMRLKKAAELQNSSNRNYCPKEQMSENKSVGATRRLNESLFQYQNKDELYGNTFDLDGKLLWLFQQFSIYPKIGDRIIICKSIRAILKNLVFRPAYL